MRSPGPPKLVCLTPVRNEIWVLERFLRCAERWAHTIVIVDHNSTDGSRELARAHPKVHLVEYDREEYDDPVRRSLLIQAARDVVPGPRVLVALDADEFLVPGFTESRAWQAFAASAPGTLGRMRWVNVMPQEPRAWIPPDDTTDFAFVDDGSPLEGAWIHGPRLPPSRDGDERDLGPVVLHLQYLDSERMRSKQRWYQATEHIKYPARRPIQIYRQYHHMDAIPPRDRHPLDQRWVEAFTEIGVDLLAVSPQPAYATDARVLGYFQQYGGDRFRRIDLWDVDWSQRASALGVAPELVPADPRTRADKLIFTWLARTQRICAAKPVRWIQRTLRIAGW